MSSLGKTINLYLMDGSASGRWQAALSNWNGSAYKISHQMLKNCADLDDFHTPGIYFLYGKDDESDKPFVYIGEADDIQKRLLQPHTFEKGGSYWTEAVIFVTPDGSLEKGRIKYLENRFYTIAKETNRYIVKNGNTPKQSPVSRSTRDMLEEFIINVKLVMSCLGYPLFEPLPSEMHEQNLDEDFLYFSRNKGKGGKATGKITSDGFWVLKGSYINPAVAEYTPAGIQKRRKECASKIDHNGILQEDLCFGSPSYAATFVCGKNVNGLAEWKNKNGIPLKQIDTVVSNDQLHLAGKKVKAKGRITEDGFIVLKGSGFSNEETGSCASWIRKQRAELIAQGKVKDCLFTEDVCFKSPSAAASCVLGASSNGNAVWLYPDGTSLKEKQ